jgi:hypothetical protein
VKRALALREVPVIVLDHLTETQKRAYVIADNQLALNASWMKIYCAWNSLLCARKISLSI